MVDFTDELLASSDNVLHVSTTLSFTSSVILALQDLGAVRFGSREWGGSREDSDWDYVLPLEKANALKREILASLPSGVKVDDNDYYVSGYYVSDMAAGKVINVTGCKKEDFKAWKVASNMMRQAECNNMTKDNRQTLFETIFAIQRRALINRDE